jgi:hypothetical protein
MAKKKVSNTGRPTKMTSEVVTKLEHAFAIDASVEEACSYAEISRNTFYEYLKRNPSFQDRIDDLRQRPVLKARQTIAKSLDDPNHAKWYLERKRRKEYGANIDLTTEGEKIQGNTIIFADHAADGEPEV